MAETKGERSEQAERRRALTAKPFEEADAAADGESDAPRAQLAAGVKRAAVTAVAAAAAGALGAVTKALLERRASRRAGDGENAETDEREPNARPADEQRADEERDSPERQEPEGAAPRADGIADVPAEPPAADDSSGERADADGHGGEPHATVTDREAPTEPADPEQPQAREHDEPGDREQSEEPTPEEARGAEPRSDSDERAAPTAATVVDRARSELQQLIGSEPESVSGLERSDGAWTITFEVVEDRRVPDSMDVLSSYEVVLEDDGGVQRIARTHRYRRSQVEQM